MTGIPSGYRGVGSEGDILVCVTQLKLQVESTHAQKRTDKSHVGWLVYIFFLHRAQVAPIKC